MICRVNITLGPKEERQLITGMHTVADIHCAYCEQVLGWKYVRFPVKNYFAYIVVVTLWLVRAITICHRSCSVPFIMSCPSHPPRNFHSCTYNNHISYYYLHRIPVVFPWITSELVNSRVSVNSKSVP